MNVFLLLDDKKLPCSLPQPDAEHAEVDAICPLCGATTFGVYGTGRRPSLDDRAWEADGRSTCCQRYVGTIRMEMNTVFGVREDEAVFSARCRVY
jgi:hypothetical protein